MPEAEPVLSLVHDIYDAALDPALWADVLGKVRDFVGGSAAAVYSRNATEKSLNVYYRDDQLDPHYRRSTSTDMPSSTDHRRRILRPDRAACRHN